MIGLAIQIRLRFEDVKTELEVSDDGIGFEPSIEQRGGGFGISGMKERVQKIGGTLEIQTAPGKGTKVILSVQAGTSEHLDQHVPRSNPKETEG